MKKPPIRGLYYITHVANLPSILRRGVLSHEMVEAQGLDFTPIYDAQIVSNRRQRTTPAGKSLWSYANFYFQPRNPMLYRVSHETDKENLAVICVQPSVLNLPGAFVSTGNAASGPSEILPPTEGLKSIAEMWELLQSEYWHEGDGSKRKIMAECLVPDMVRPELIQTIYVASAQTADRVKASIRPAQVSVSPEPYMFFLPRWRRQLTTRLLLVDGDMFFSAMQTLTVSVNTVGIMGKGLASRAKYQFPDVYVVYQDLCRKRTLRMGVPYLYKRESSVDAELAADPFSFAQVNAEKWFLLFPTKRHWRENSDFKGIEAGMKWLLGNYEVEGIRSLAIPALGCGLGGLEWKDVGPLMCSYLNQMDIQTAIYLPRERPVPDELLTKEFLLG